MNITNVICSKCGKVAEYSQAQADGWLIAQRPDQPEGYLVIRCPDHITDHARRQVGLKQQHFAETKAKTGYVTVFPTPGFTGKWTLTDGKGNELQEGFEYDSREVALDAATKLWPDGRRVRGGWRIKAE